MEDRQHPQRADRQSRAPGSASTRTAPSRHGALRKCVAGIVSLSLLLPIQIGCTTGLGKLSSMNILSRGLTGKKEEKKVRKKEADNHFGDRVDTPLLSEYISVQGNNHVVLRGVGLVTGLDGTGDDPPPSSYRTQLQNEMSRRGVPNAGRILASEDTALVIVTALLPPMVRKGQRFDVRVVLPPNSQATSLSGGWLLPTNLHEEQVVEGRGALKGHEYATAGGAILLALGANDDRTQKRDLLSRGSIPGGAVSKTDRDLSVVLRTERRGFRNSKRVASTIAERFHHYDKFGQRVALAEAKTDSMIELKVHPSYRNNFPRYQKVIRSLAFHESQVARRMRMETLAERLLNPATTYRAALELEAIGDRGIPFLERALTVDNPEVQFEAAQALAYLGNAEGVEVLKRAAQHEPAFRVYALAALSVIDDADAVIALRDLMNHESLETRYGAFTSLKELDPRDPSIPYKEFDTGFRLYNVSSQGEPMVHVKRYRAPEVVLFGSEQLLRLPAVLNAGRNIRVIGQPNGNEVTITRYRLNAESQTRTVSTRLFDILKTVGDMGATYPDVVQLLIEAEQQHNLSGQFGIDRLPQAGRTYQRSRMVLDAHEVGDERRVGAAAQVPNMFDRLEEHEIEANEEAERRLDQAVLDDLPSDDALPTRSADAFTGSADDSATETPSASGEAASGNTESQSSVDRMDGGTDDSTAPDSDPLFELGEPGGGADRGVLDREAASAESASYPEPQPTTGQKIKDFFSNPFRGRSSD